MLFMAGLIAAAAWIAVVILALAVCVASSHADVGERAQRQLLEV